MVGIGGRVTPKSMWSKAISTPDHDFFLNRITVQQPPTVHRNRNTKLLCVKPITLRTELMYCGPGTWPQPQLLFTHLAKEPNEHLFGEMFVATCHL